jgi:TPR repeat protein
MKMTVTFVAALIGALLALPSSAQGTDQRRAAEMAFERAEAEFDRQRARREAAHLACEARDWAACYTLAEFQRTGQGGLQDLTAAARNYSKTCDARDGRGCAGLAYLTLHGRGVSASPAEARRLYRKSCDLGEVSGCAAWGNMAYTGAGGPKDTAGGTRALSDACERGFEWACNQMRKLGTYDVRDRPFERLRDLRTF